MSFGGYGDEQDYDEIKRLRAKVDALNSALATTSAGNARLVAENATLRQALKNHAEEAAKMVSAEPVAYLHTMHCEFDQTNDRLTFEEQHPFGIAGENYSAEYPVTTTPLYCRPKA